MNTNNKLEIEQPQHNYEKPDPSYELAPGIRAGTRADSPRVGHIDTNCLRAKARESQQATLASPGALDAQGARHRGRRARPGTPRFGADARAADSSLNQSK